MSNAMLLTNNTGASIAAGAVVPLGSAVHGFGSAIKLNGNSIRLGAPGHYDIEAVLSADITASGSVTLSVLENGAVVNSVTVTGAAGEYSAIPLIWNTYVNCACNSKVITFTLSAAATDADFTVEVRK